MSDTLSSTAAPQDILTFISDLAVNEALPARAQHDGQLARNKQIYVGEHWLTSAPAGLHQFVINRVQRAIHASVAVETEQRPRVGLSPVESGDPSLVYLSPAGVAKLEQLANETNMEPMLDPAQLQGLAPFDEATMELLMAQVREVETPPTSTYEQSNGQDAEGNPTQEVSGETVVEPATEEPIFVAEDFILVNDTTASEAMQRVYDVMWDRTSSDYVWTDNLLNKRIFGWQPMLLYWDADKHLYCLHNVHHRNILIDPTAQGVEDADYVIFMEPMSAEEAVSRWPEYADAVTKFKSDGSLQDSQGVDGRWQMASVFRETDFERDMVVIVTAWLRHQPIPLTPEEAAERGVTPAVMQMPDAMGNVVDEPVIAEDGTPAYQLPDGELIDPASPQWPTRPGIRQIRLIGDEVVDDRECPFADIPLAWNINIPIPHSPYGQGDPERLWPMQDFANRLTSTLYDHVKYYAHPQEYVPFSCKEINNQSAPHAHPGKRYWVPDDIYREFLAGKNGGFAVDPPTVPASYVDLLGMMLNLLDEESDNSGVMQGRVPQGVESGKAIDMLQTAARGAIGFKALYTERAITQAARLQVAMIRDYLPESEWVKYVSGYPVQILLALRERAKNLEYDIRVEVVSGKGSNRRMKQQEAIQQFQLGLRGPKSTMRLLEIDRPEQEIADILASPISPLAQQMQQAQMKANGSSSSSDTRSEAA